MLPDRSDLGPSSSPNDASNVSPANTPAPQDENVEQVSPNAPATPEAEVQSRDPLQAEPQAGEEATTAMPEVSEAHRQADRPSQRIQIGSQRDSRIASEAKAKPVTKPVTEAKSSPQKKEPKHYPPPNIRDRLSPELEAEYEAALGELSLDKLMEEGASAPGTELAPETRLTARVVKVSREDVFFDLGNSQQGTVPKRQFDELPDEGDELELVVVRYNADEGLYELSRPAMAIDVGNWDEIEDGQIVEVTIVGSNKGGLECQVAGIRGFIPMGQISLYRVENPEEYHGQRLPCVVTEANRDRRNLVLSHRAVMERQRNEQRDKLIKELAVGQIREGVVRSLKDFGAFVDLGGVDGLVHVSQLSWDRVNHPSEVLEVGQQIKVRIEKFDADTGKLSLSYREVGESPWEKVDQKYPVGLRASGTISRIMDFGAFVKLEPGVEGLIHVSELAHGRVFRVSDIVSEGQQVEVKVLNVDREKQRMSLSLKALLEKPTKEGDTKVADEDLPLPPDAPKAPKKKSTTLKGGISGPSGGEKFGLNW